MKMNRGAIVELEIVDYAFGGRGIAKIPSEQGDYIVFVDNTFPGQKVSCRITKKRKRHAEAKLLAVLERSSSEVEMPYQEISGGPYIHVPVALQEQYKKDSTLQVLTRIGNVKDIDTKFDTFISSPDHYFYRNKMEYSFSSIEHDLVTDEELDDAFALGFKRRGTWWKVESLNAPSGLFDQEWETKLKDFRIFLQSFDLPAWHPPQKTGFFRYIVVRKSFKQDQLLINLVTSSEGIEQFDAKATADKLVELFGNRIAGIQHTINDNVADRAKIENGDCKLLYGEPIVVESLLGLEFEISMESFFQTNPKCAELLYTKAIDYVLEEVTTESQVIMDLFCGTGTIGQILAKKVNANIIGVDIVEEAIEDAKRNAKRNGLDNLKFFASDVGKFLYNYPEYQGGIDSIVLDPPRAGIAPKTLRKVIALNANHIVYISCNPSTQARDTDTLQQAGYEVEKITLVDQFPHTGHVESIIKFKKQ